MSTLQLDLPNSHTYLCNPWAYGGGVSRAAMLLRKDVQRHLLLARDELGFRHIRFAGVFDDELAILQPDGSHDFTKLEVAFDWLMEQGLAPYIVLSGVPSALATEGSKRPVDFQKWADLCGGLARFVDGRYGCDAQEWHWEVWPEPDSTESWDGSRQDYFRLFDLAAKAVKAVNPQLKVGGPGAADLGFVEAFIDHVNSPIEGFIEGVARCDFVSFSGLSTEASPAGRLVELCAAVRQKAVDTLGEATPVILSAWSAAGSTPSLAHDRLEAGAAVVMAAAGFADIVTGAIYHRVSDVDDAGGSGYEPFHGGCGLITVNDIKKASFNAMKLLNEHNAYKLDHQLDAPTPGLTIFTTKDYHNVVRVLAAYEAPATAPGEKSPAAKFAISGLADSIRYGQVQVLRPAAGSPLESWTELGRPQFVNRYLLEDLESAAHPFTTEVNFLEYPPRLESGMVLQLTIPIPDDAAYLD